MTSSEYDELVGLIQDAAPLIAVAAFKGGSLFYKAWLDRAGALGIELVDPNTYPASQSEGTSGELE